MTNPKRLLLLLVSISLLVGLFAIAPQLFIWKNLHDQGKPYLGLTWTATNDQVAFYYPRAREIYDGHFPPGDLYPDSAQASPFNVLPSLLTALPIYLFRGDINLAFFFTEFLFSIIIFLAFYSFGRVLFKERIWAFFTGLVAILTPLARFLHHILLGPGKFIDLVVTNFYPLVRSQIQFLFLSRSDDPLITFAVYIPALALLSLLWLQPRRSTAIWLGIFYGLLIYTYLHYWIYFTIFIGLLFGRIFLNRSRDPERFKLFSLTFGITGILAIPYFINYFVFSHLADAKAFCDRVCFMDYGRYLRLSGFWSYYILYAILALIVYWLYFKKDRHRAILFLASLAAMVLILNMQVILGYTLVSGRLAHQAFNPIVLVMVINIIFDLARRLNRRAVAGVLMVLMALLVTKKLVNAWEFYKKPDQELLTSHEADPNLVSAWDWLNKNVEGEPKIISPSFMTAMYLGLYTSARPYLPFWTYSQGPLYDIEERFLKSQKLFKVNKDFIRYRITKEIDLDRCAEIRIFFNSSTAPCTEDGLRNLLDTNDLDGGNIDMWSIYGNSFAVRPAGYKVPFWTGRDIEKARVSDQKAKEMFNRYENLKVSWSDIGADYAFYGPLEMSIADGSFAKDSDLLLVYQNPGVKIYKIVK